MTGAGKRKGDAAEREVAALLANELGYPVRRQLGAGRADDVGDIAGVPRTVIQVANWADVLRAVREKPLAVETQRVNAGADFAATFVRMWGGTFRVVQTPGQFVTLLREALA